MDLREYSQAVRQHWITFLAVVAVALAAGLTAIFLPPPRYVSSVRLLVTIEGSTTASAYRNDDAVASRINTYIPLLTSDAVTRPVQQKLGLHLSDADMAGRISVTRVPPRTALIDVQTQGPSADQAQVMAQTLSDAFVQYTQAIETGTGEDGQKVHTQVVSPASPARSNGHERVLLGLLVLAGAVLIGLVAVWLQTWRLTARVSTEA